MAEAVFHMKDIRKKMTLKVTLKGVRVFRIRLRLGLLLIKCGAWVAGFGVEISDQEKEGHD